MSFVDREDKSRLLNNIIIHFATLCFDIEVYSKFADYYSNFLINPSDENYYRVLQFVDFALCNE